ncbi:hypothetical protein [Larkinella humicola]|uniref:Uncharacterized protein n=1 Tax=Larkinella humicola TaxID=2607654 RepID=A0A5N1JHV3_9BACT|nr:hypothetical protein [Larkinella humicola]KAA9355008.1 hypothetical protein F0P93_10520 [Larkinella humicola]
MELLFRKAKYMGLVIFLALVGSTSRYHSGALPVISAPLAKDCFSGKWGNDFVLCDKEKSGKKGKSNQKNRLEEELVLQFKGKDKGELSFYDCRNTKRSDLSISFHYEVTNEVIRFYWEGKADEIETYKAAFNFRDTFRYDCRKDTLVFTDGFLNNTLYQGSTYFVRR